MQGHVTFVFAFLVAYAAAASTAATSAANAWMQSHKSPTDDQLKELAGANPEAYAVVNALLSKHMKHLRQPGEMSGADVFRSMMTPAERMGNFGKSHTSEPYASAGLVEEHAPAVATASYNPNAATNRDESSVSRLLSAVASMGGKKGKKIQALLKKHEKKQEVDNPLTEDASLFEEAPKAVPVQDIVAAAAMPVEQVQAPEPPQTHENSYLKGIDLSGDMPVAEGQKHHLNKQNSYLKGIDMSGADSLQSFSFGDDEKPAAPKPVVKVAAPKPKKPENAFLKFLYGVKKAPAPVAQPAAAAPKKEGNSYLDSVKFFG